MSKKPRPLVKSLVVKNTPSVPGGGRPRAALVERAKQSIERGSGSFATASMLFSKTTRERSHMLYAWCRRCDDIADGQDHGGELNLEGSSGEQRIDAIRVLTQRALDGQPTADISFDALGLVAAEVRLSPALCEDAITGFALDTSDWRPQSEADLMRYCYHVAGAVGVMMARVMGVGDERPELLDRACDLGLSFQLNNIARDIDEDACAGRCYLPKDWLEEFSIAEGEHMAAEHRVSLVVLAKRLVHISRLHEDTARLGIRALSFRQRWAVLTAANIYGAIGSQVIEQAELAWETRIYVSGFAKFGHALSAFWEAIFGPHEPAETPQWTRAQLVEVAREGLADDGPQFAPLPDEELREV